MEQREEFSFFCREVFRFALLRALVVEEKGGDRGKARPAVATWMAENHPKHGICGRIARLSGGEDGFCWHGFLDCDRS